MSNTTYDPQRPLASENLDLIDTDMPVSASHDHTARDHMGRRQAATVGEAFRQDWPYILGLIALMAFVIGAIGGYFR